MKKPTLLIPHDLSANLDKWGLICHLGDDGNLDGGDTCANEFTYLYALAALDQPIAQGDRVLALSYLAVNGIPRRHPDSTKWYSTVDRTSRDQLTPYVAYLASQANIPLERAYFQRLALQHAKRLFCLTWNTRRNHVYERLEDHLKLSTPDVKHDYSWKLPDLCTMDIWQIYVRGALNMLPTPLKWLLALVLQPLLMILDVQSFVAVLMDMYKFYVLKWPVGKALPRHINHDARNCTLKVHFAAHHSPTLLSLLTYRLWRPLGALCANSWWSQRGEPPLHLLVSRL
jgi:hypothetical protein